VAHNESDQFSKNVLREALSRASATETEVEVLAATQKIDVYCVPDPARDAERAHMGLIGELSAVPTMFEPFHDTPSFRHVRTCLRKQLTWAHELERRARAAAGSPSPSETSEVDEDPDASTPGAVPYPVLVVISPGRAETALRAFGCTASRPGVYDAVEEWAVRILVLAELPRTRDTLLLRLLSKGRIYDDALADLAALPEDAWERGVAMPILVCLRPETKEASGVNNVEIREWFEGVQAQKRDEGRKEGRDEGRKEGELTVLLRLLRARFGELSASAMARIEAADVEDLERWADRLLNARTLDEVLG
jgi:hypothetical protein